MKSPTITFWSNIQVNKILVWGQACLLVISPSVVSGQPACLLSSFLQSISTVAFPRLFGYLFVPFSLLLSSLKDRNLEKKKKKTEQEFDYYKCLTPFFICQIIMQFDLKVVAFLGFFTLPSTCLFSVMQ